MDALERLRELEADIDSRLLLGESLEEIGRDVADEYIKLVKQIEGKSEYFFSKEMIGKYKYLQMLSEIRNKKFLNS